MVIFSQEGFLSEIASKKVKERIELKIKRRQPLDDRDLLDQWLKIAAVVPDVDTFEEQITD